ncbi:neuromedin-B receptor-like [Anneissia japonica]|uniref:neuromedin-B receptor-like n=1 Tax=Anneissia japonica TaxID=1529436 RepID=UPI001425589B|nr:neuromedin-B receptor-like [Anneissia japonica]
MRNTRNLLICNIAVGDLLLIISYPTYTLPYIFSQLSVTWTDFLCKFFRGFLLLSQGISVLSLAWLSIERYQAFSPTERGFVSRYISYITFSIWIVATLFTLPHIISSHAEGEGDFSYCEGFGKLELSGQIYSIFQFSALYMIPLLIITVHYCLIISILFKSMQLMPVQTSNRDDQIRRRKRSSLVLLLITIMFSICWLPYFIHTILTEFNREVLNEMWLFRFKQISELMIYISTCINPVTLFMISKRHRRYFKKYLCCSSERSRQFRSELLSNARLFFYTRQTPTSEVLMRTNDCATHLEYATLKKEDVL